MCVPPTTGIPLSFRPTMTSMTSHDLMTECRQLWCTHPGITIHPFEINQIRKPWKSHFLTSWPWPSTYDLDHHTWPRFYLGKCVYQFSSPYLKRFSCECAELYTHTHTHTQTWPILLPRPLMREVKRFCTLFLNVNSLWKKCTLINPFSLVPWVTDPDIWSWLSKWCLAPYTLPQKKCNF